MARPISIRNEQILEAARELFLEQGMEASTAAIARRAGVSEGSIFKRFRTKEDLFRESMGLPEFDLEGLLEERVGRSDIREHLVEIAVEFIRFFRVLMPRMLRLWAHTCSPPEHFQKRDGYEPPPVRGHRLLSKFFEREMKLGRVRKGDPKVMARMLIGTVHNFVFFEVVGMSAQRDAEEFAREVVDLMWKGAAP